MPGAWTCIEEYRGIDLLAWSAWSSASSYGRIGYEVKVSRSDLRNELLNPHKRARNVEWCHEFYFVVPKGLLKIEEMTWKEPEWDPRDFVGEPCPGVLGNRCTTSWRRKKHKVDVPIPVTGHVALWGSGYATIVCPTCNGKGTASPSRVEQEAPTCWVPRDVGLVVVDKGRTEMVKRSPRRRVPALTDRELGQLVRWVSVRPDPRHARAVPMQVAS